jgi:hypothetical protein
MKDIANNMGIQVRLTETVSILREYSAPRSYPTLWEVLEFRTPCNFDHE